MPSFQVTVAGLSTSSPTSTIESSVTPTDRDLKSLPNGYESLRVLGPGRVSVPMDVALMKLIPSINAFNNGEMPGDMLSQRLLRALLIKDIAAQTGVARHLFNVHDGLQSGEQATYRVESEKEACCPKPIENGSSPIIINKKSVSFSNLTVMSSSPSVGGLANSLAFPPTRNAGKKVTIFSLESHGHREDVFVFSSLDAPDVSSSPPSTSSHNLSCSPSMNSLLPMASSSHNITSSLSNSSSLLSLPNSLAFPQVSSSAPNVEVYHVSEVLSSHVTPPIIDEYSLLASSGVACEDEQHLESDAMHSWKAEGSARVVVDRTKHSIVIEQYSCRFYTRSLL